MDCGIIKNQPQKKHNLSRNPNSSTEFTSLSQNNSMSYSIRQQTYSKEPITLVPPMKSTIDITPMKKHNPSFFLNQASSRSTDKKNTIDSSTVSFPRISKLRSNSNINININITNVSPKRNPPPQKNHHLNKKLKFDTSIFNSFDKQNTLGVSNSCENIYHTNNSSDHPILRLTKKRPFNSPVDKITFSSVLTDRRAHRKIGSYEFRGDLVVNKDILKCDQLLNKIKQRNLRKSYRINQEKLSLGQELFQIQSPKFEIKKTKKCLTIINEEKKTLTEGTGSLESTQKLTKKNQTKKRILVPSPTKKIKSNIFHFNQNVKLNKNNEHKDSIRHSLSSDYLGMFEIKPKQNTLHFLDSKCLNTSFTLQTESTVLSTIYSQNKILKYFYKNIDKKERAYYNASEKKNIMIKQKTLKFKNFLYSNYNKKSTSYFHSIDNYYSLKGTTMYYNSIFYNNSVYPYEISSSIEKDCSLKYPLTDYIIMNYLMIDSDIASEYLFQNKTDFFESYNVSLPKKEKIKATKSGIISDYIPTFQTQDQRDNMLYIQKAIYQDYIMMKKLYGYTTTEGNERERKRHKTTRTVRTRKGKNTLSLNVLQHKNFYYWRNNNKYSDSQIASSLAAKLIFRKNSDISPTGKTKSKERGLTYLVRRSTVMSSQDIMKMLTNSSDLFDALIKLLKTNQIDLFRDAFVRSKSEIQIDQVDNEGNTLLIYACIAGSLEAVKLLIEGGADPNIQNVSYILFTHYYRT